LTTDTGQRHAYGWRPSPPDKRDYRYQARVDPATLPASVDLSASLPPAWDQSQLGSCTAFTGAAAVVFDLVKQGIGLAFVPSFLFLYYNERKDDGTIPVDAGSSMREIAKALAKYGLAHDAFWPYNISRFADAPPAAAYDDGLKTVLTQYLAVAQDVNAIKSCLADGYPVMVGVSVYQSFENAAATGDVPMPAPPNDRLRGSWSSATTTRPAAGNSAIPGERPGESPAMEPCHMPSWPMPNYPTTSGRCARSAARRRRPRLTRRRHHRRP
jgi:hypothetical protein